MTNFRESDVIKWNKEQFEMRENLPGMYISMLEAVNGSHNHLELQLMPKWKLEDWKMDGKLRKVHHQYFVVMDKKLNDLLIFLKGKYCDISIHTFAAKYNNNKMGAKSCNKVFDREEIETMLMNYLLTFPSGMVKVKSDISVSVPPIESFKGENDEHSNNKLIKYIINNFEKQVILPVMHQEKKVKRIMIKGKTYFVKLDDLEFISFEDMDAPQKDSNRDDEIITFFDLTRKESELSTYGKQKVSEFIFNKYKEVLTKDQLEKFQVILEAANNKKVNIDDLFHSVTGKVNVEALGKILYANKENNFIQPQVRNMLKSMKKRMEKEIEKQGFNQVEVRSDYAPFPHLPANENKMYRDYKIHSKYIIRDFELEGNDIYKNVKWFKDEQFIESAEVDKIHNEEMTVKEFVIKHNLDKNIAKSMDGVLTTYKPSRDGEQIIDNEERQRLLNAHCKAIWDSLLTGYIKFESKDGWMIPLNTKSYFQLPNTNITY
ncbi:hypothetical protein J7E63_21325 [Bacillus sp. ISL-75]|uniref:hypothetical protein n=1 Tax=Bacillus sp. ISL-75 TaxID=2819137 RepID=UPI001BE9DBCF|nr:hypothetical protein [Bacillus sp. ISL-75]MBT2729437.1 hypothetical protein [Bacillus sp. ISL-75]